MKNKMSLVMIIWTALAWFNCEKADPLSINVVAEIEKEMEAQGIRSLVACVIKEDEIAWEGSFGYSDVDQISPTTPQTLYTIMSIGKLVLSTAVMQLWEEDYIDLDADINQYLPFSVRHPKYPDQQITPYMLLNHRSGLTWPADSDGIPDFHHFYVLGEEAPLIGEWLPEYILPGGSQYRENIWKDYPPGAQFYYSNIGTSLLGLIVENISGMDYRDYCRVHIFEPLEMNNTAFRLDRLDPDLLVTPFDDNNNPMYYYTCRHYPAGFISSNLEDFSHFVVAILNYGEYNGMRILEASTTRKMLELQDPTSGTANLWVHCLGDCIGHAGGGTGFSTWVEWHFESDRAFFIFSNKVNGSVYPKGRLYELVKYQAMKY